MSMPRSARQQQWISIASGRPWRLQDACVLCGVLWRCTLFAVGLLRLLVEHSAQCILQDAVLPVLLRCEPSCRTTVRSPYGAEVRNKRLLL